MTDLAEVREFSGGYHWMGYELMGWWPGLDVSFDYATGEGVCWFGQCTVVAGESGGWSFADVGVDRKGRAYVREGDLGLLREAFPEGTDLPFADYEPLARQYAWAASQLWPVYEDALAQGHDLVTAHRALRDGLGDKGMEAVFVTVSGLVTMHLLGVA